MNTNNNQPITAALPELAVIGNLVYKNYDASRLVDAIVREDLREEHFSMEEPISVERVISILRDCGIPMLKTTFITYLTNNLNVSINTARGIINEALVLGKIVEGKKTLPGSKKMLGFPEWFRPHQNSLSETVTDGF